MVCSVYSVLCASLLSPAFIASASLPPLVAQLLSWVKLVV